MKKTENEIGEALIGCAMSVHSGLGPGLLESAYEGCLAYELGKRDIIFRRQVLLPVHYDGEQIDSGYRLDLLVDEKVVIEIKAVEKLNDLHRAQLLTYLKLGDYKLGYLLHFNTLRMRDGIVRLVNGLEERHEGTVLLCVPLRPSASSAVKYFFCVWPGVKNP